MIRIFTVLIFLLAANSSLAAIAEVDIRVLSLKQSTVVLQFISKKTGEPTKYNRALGRKGFLAFNFWFEQDLKSKSAVDNLFSAKEVKNFWNGDSMQLTIPLSVPLKTTSAGNMVNLDIIARNQNDYELIWSKSIDIRLQDVARDWFGDTGYDEVIAQINSNQISDANVMLAMSLDTGNKNTCIDLLEARFGLIQPDYKHCHAIANPVLGKNQLDGGCITSTDQQFNNVVAGLEASCKLTPALNSGVWPDNQLEYNTKIFHQLSTKNQVQDITLNKGSLDWMGDRLSKFNAPSEQLDSFKELRFNSEQLKRNLYYSKLNHQYLIKQPAFKDLLLSELIKGVVNKHFKMRRPFSDWCQVNSSWDDAGDICFQFAADISVKLFEVYGFKNLYEFNQSIKTFRNNYIEWAIPVLGDKEAEKSLAFIVNWGVEFTEKNFGKFDCASQQLFPLGKIMSSKKVPDFKILAYPGKDEYKNFVDSLAVIKEQFVQQIWTDVGNYKYEPDIILVTCANITVYGELFASVMQEKEL